MRYLMKSGILSSTESDKVLAHIKSTFWGAKKTISLLDSGLQYVTDIDCENTSPSKRADVRYRVYRLRDENNKVMMEAHPGYAKEDDPDLVGWPTYRAPKVDHADIRIGDMTYLLIMNNSQNYELKDGSGSTILQIMHRGISGGWTIEAAHALTVQELCGLFIFCRYLEQENEFVMV